ncbi:MAG: hypothetical protein ACRCUP_01365 [Mycoplasmatales bacterium]
MNHRIYRNRWYVISSNRKSELDVLETNYELPKDFIVKDNIARSATYYRYIEKYRSKSTFGYLRDHPGWGWTPANASRSFCQGKISSSISTSLSIGGKWFSVGVGYSSDSNSRYDCVNTPIIRGKSVRPTLQGSSYFVGYDIQHFDRNSGKHYRTTKTEIGYTKGISMRYRMN